VIHGFRWKNFPVIFYDAHNHLHDAWLAPHRAQVITDLARIPLAIAVVNGTCQSDWPEVTALARDYEWVLPSYGLHPWNVGNATDSWHDDLRRTLDSAPHAGVGEIGIDRWILERARADDSRLTGLRRAPLDEQLTAFTWQLDLAAQRNLPVTVHCIDAWGALHEALRSASRPARGFLLHAYGGSAELARDFAALGAYFSFNGYFLGERQAARRAVFTTLPLERLLVETDAPAMPPPAGQRAYSLPGLADGNPLNHPANIAAVYAGLAAIRATTIDSLAEQVAANFHRLFGAR
jgi:TatD DNase family protein